MQLVIHAGVHRTGTTSLQRALEKARPALAARGIVYPGTETNQQALQISELRLTVDPANPAQRLYYRLGYTLQAEVADYFGPGEDRLLLVKTLSGTAAIQGQNRLQNA